MVRLFLNKDVVYKSKDTFACVYHKGTGWYYPCKRDFWEPLQSYRDGKDVDSEKLTPALAELVRNRKVSDSKEDCRTGRLP